MSGFLERQPGRRGGGFFLGAPGAAALIETGGWTGTRDQRTQETVPAASMKRKAFRLW